MKNKVAALLLVGHLFTAGMLNAAVLVDTGPGPSTAGFNLTPSQYFAGQFSLVSPVIVTDILGWIGGAQRLQSGGGIATAAIYTDGGEVPGTELFAQKFTADIDFDFDGVTGLSLLLPAGTYWVGFEGRLGDTIDGTMPSPSTSPLGNEAVNVGAGYIPFDDVNFGVRILGNVITPGGTIPEPASLMLLGVGLAALGWMRRRKG
jgi:hypothetical protein